MYIHDHKLHHWQTRWLNPLLIARGGCHANTLILGSNKKCKIPTCAFFCQPCTTSWNCQGTWRHSQAWAREILRFKLFIFILREAEEVRAIGDLLGWSCIWVRHPSAQSILLSPPTPEQMQSHLAWHSLKKVLGCWGGGGKRGAEDRFYNSIIMGCGF